MLQKSLDTITQADVQSLVDNGVNETRTVEYKLLLPGTRDEDKKEFLADVSSLANAAGGHLIYGVKAIDGVPIEAPGLVGFNEDQERLRLESILRDSLDPRLHGIQIAAVTGFPSGPVVLLRVPRSWTGPHRVKFRGTSRFWSRSSAGKFEMDTADIRSAFEGAGDLPRRIRDWRDERLGRIIANDGPVALSAASAIVAHLIPIESFSDPWRIPVSQLHRLQLSLPPMAAGGWSHRINMDGLLTYDVSPERRQYADSYTQLFRSGIVEAVNAEFITTQQGGPMIPSVWYEEKIIQAVHEYLKCLKGLGIGSPLIFLLTLLGAKGASLTVSARMFRGSIHAIDRDVLLVPEVMIDDLECAVDQVLRPAFDAVWNACGYERSFNYDENGTWNPPR